MLVLMFAGIVGGILTSTIGSVWFGAIGSLALAPIGGSLAALAAAVAVAARRIEDVQEFEPTLLLSTDEQVRALNEIAARGRMAMPATETQKTLTDRAA
jgi:hypothetical protein